MKKLDAPIPRIAMSIPKAATALDVGPDFFAANILPELKVIRCGSKRLIPMAELERWCAENAERTLG